MKIKILLLLTLQICVVHAQQLPPNDALSRAINVESLYSASIINGHQENQDYYKLCFTSKSGSENYFYVFNKGADNGFIIISADERVTPIIGYTSKGRFDENNISCGLKDLLEDYKKQIAFAFNENVCSTKTIRDSERIYISPLIETTWDQDYPYNLLCPIDPNTGERSKTGCVAVAMAQVMHYYKWPYSGRNSNSYIWHNQTLSADFSQVQFDYDKMRPSYYDDETSDEENQAVANLMYYCGIASNANYSSNSTWAYVDTEILHKYFKYKDQLQWLKLKNTSIQNFEQVVYNELLENRPVLFLASDQSRTSHLMVIDGYDNDNDLFHINMGWGGYDDGFYKLNIIPVYYYFDRDQSILYNIEPEQETPVDAINGDVNGDGQVTAADVTALYDFLLNNDNSHLVNGDQTGDNQITAADVTAVYTVLLNN